MRVNELVLSYKITLVFNRLIHDLVLPQNLLTAPVQKSFPHFDSSLLSNTNYDAHSIRGFALFSCISRNSSFIYLYRNATRITPTSSSIRTHTHTFLQEKVTSAYKAKLPAATESITQSSAWIMDAHKQQTPNNELPQRTKAWKPQSRIAGYIKGSVKLEEMVSREKLVRPEHRHNRRAFMALVNDDDEPNCANTLFKSKSRFSETRRSTEVHRSTTSRCPSTSTKTSTSLSRAGSVHPHQQLTTDDLTRTIIEKNEYITALREQLDKLRSCARVETLPQAGAEPMDGIIAHHSLRVVLERMLECLLDMLTNLRHYDEHDERMAQFVATVERERENVLRSVDALCQANARKEDELRQMSGEQTALRERLQQLQKDIGFSREERRQSVRHNILQQKLRVYEEMYRKATDEVRHLSSLTESVRKHIDAQKEAFNERAAVYRKQTEEHEKCVQNLQTSCSSLKEKKEEAEKKLAQIEKEHADEVARLRKKYEGSIAVLETDTQKLEEEKRQMQAEQAELEEQLRRARQENEEISSDIKRLREEKEALERDLAERERSDTDEIVQRPVENDKMTSFAKQESQWHELKERFFKTVLRAGIAQDDDVR